MAVRWRLAVLSCAAFAGAVATTKLSAHDAFAADAVYGEYLSSECVTCHRGDGQDKGIPSIIGWPREQFITVLKAYKTKDRPNQIMQAIAGRLSDDDMAALAAFYENLKPSR